MYCNSVTSDAIAFLMDTSQTIRSVDWTGGRNIFDLGFHVKAMHYYTLHTSFTLWKSAEGALQRSHLHDRTWSWLVVIALLLFDIEVVKCVILRYNRTHCHASDCSGSLSDVLLQRNVGMMCLSKSSSQIRWKKQTKLLIYYNLRTTQRWYWLFVKEDARHCITLSYINHLSPRLHLC